MINQQYLEKLINLINAGLIVVDDIKIQEYKDAVQEALSTQ